MKLNRTLLRCLLCASLIAMVGLAVWKREGIMTRIHHARANAHLAGAYRAGDDNDWRTSERLSLAAWQLKSGDADILRQLFKSARELRSRHLLIAADALFDHPDSTAEDRLTVLNLHLELGDYVTLKHLLAQLSEDELAAPAAKHVGIRFFLARQDGPRALALTDRLLRVRSEAADLLLAAEVYARVPTADNESQSKAQEMISDLFFDNSDPTMALAAVAVLSTMDRSLWKRDLLKRVPERLAKLRREGVELPIEIELLAVEIAMALDPQSTATLLAQAMEQHGEANPDEVASWLLQLDRPDLVTTLLTPGQAKESGETSMLYVESLIQREKWEDASRFIDHPHPAIPPVTVMSLRAVISDGLGQAANANSYWERALDHANLEGGRSSLVQLARLAASHGKNDIRNRALTEALKRPSSINLPAEDVRFLFAHLSGADESEDLLAISRNLLQTEPDNPVLINNVTWLELVSGRVPRSAAIGRLVEAHPEINALRSTWTLALLAEGRNREALAVVSPLVARGIGSDELSSTDHAVIALAHHRNAQRSLATAAKAGIDWNRLMTVERRFFTEALSHSTASVDTP